MILTVIIEIFIIGIIGTLWDDEIVLYEHQKRKYKLIKAFLFLITGIISLLLEKFLGNIIYLYSFLATICFIGELFSVINANLREIYTYTLSYIIGIFASLQYLHGGLCVVAILFCALGIIQVWKESIENMMYRIDPDVRDYEEEQRKKFYKGVKTAFKLVKKIRFLK